MEFEWDAEKARQNLAKHGVTFAEAGTVLADRLSMTYPDPDHSEREERFITIGHSQQGRLLVLAYTERGSSVRIISARNATRHERHADENEV